jgi:hypothetical protein
MKIDNMKIAYICHPIAGDVHGNIEKILNIIKDINLTRDNVVPFAPYIPDILALDDNIPEQRDRGIKNDIALLRCGFVDELWVYGPRISGGMQAEIDLAYELGISIRVMDPKTEIPIHLRPIMNIGY